jgi:Ca2+-binding EF-hand superfamily protein
MGGLVTTYKFDKDDSTIQYLSSIKSHDIEECLSFYITDYPNVFRVHYRHFDDIFGAILNQVDSFFLYFSNGKTDADLLEIFAVLIIACKGSVNWKVKMLFCLFDFDNSETIDKNELSLVISAFTKALCKLGSGFPPSSSKLYLIATNIFKDIDRDNSSTLDLQEILSWSEKNLEFQELMAHFSHIQSFDLASMRYSQILKEFDDLIIPDQVSDQFKRRVGKMFQSKLNDDEMTDFFQKVSIGLVINRVEFERLGKSVLAFMISDYTDHKGLERLEIQVLLSLLSREEVTLPVAESFMRRYNIGKTERLSYKKWFSLVCEDANLGFRHLDIQ